MRIGNQGLPKLPITELYGISALVRAAVNPVQVAGYRPLLHTTDKLDDGNKVGKRSECLESIHMVHLLYQQNGRSNRVTYVNISPCGLPIYYSTVNVREGQTQKFFDHHARKADNGTPVGFFTDCSLGREQYNQNTPFLHIRRGDGIGRRISL